MVKTSLAELPAAEQEAFVEEYRRRAKSIPVAYLLWLLFGLHYVYLRNWAMQFLFWFTCGGMWIWWFIDLFRIPGIVRDHNKDAAIDVMRDLKIIKG
jgi:hypothetical protein